MFPGAIMWFLCWVCPIFCLDAIAYQAPEKPAKNSARRAHIRTLRNFYYFQKLY